MTYANRGMVLEQIIEITNNQYRQRKLAEITKVPTPVKILKKDYRGMVSGFVEKKGTVDFVGVASGKMVAFDAKETKEKNLPFGNIQQHQLDYMRNVSKMGGIAFILVYFTELDKYFRLDIKDLIGYIREPYSTNLKSIPIKFFENYATEVKQGGGLYLDYLKDL